MRASRSGALQRALLPRRRPAAWSGVPHQGCQPTPPQQSLVVRILMSAGFPEGAGQIKAACRRLLDSSSDTKQRPHLSLFVWEIQTSAPHINISSPFHSLQLPPFSSHLEWLQIPSPDVR